ncbi:hypothetical protein PWG71_12030 [Nocardiopsis sp. N85]|nr:hypothetical protein [Nocardiopsis sp. N85]MDE3722120.1 hypothetical protein [Nocardiopsis sp. N85]
MPRHTTEPRGSRLGLVVLLGPDSDVGRALAHRARTALGAGGHRV